MSIGEKIYQLRKTANLSQEQFGEMLGVSRQSVSKWESNQSQPELQTIIEISKLFNISLDELLKDEDNKNSQNTFEMITKMKMKFNFGCLLIFIGVLIFISYLFVCQDIILWYGDPVDWLINSIRIGELTVVWFFIVDFFIIGLGVYLCLYSVGLTKNISQKLKYFISK